MEKGTYSERSAIGEADGQVCKDGEQPIGQGGSEGQVVGDLVDGEEEVLVRRRAKNVRHGPELPRPERRVPEEVCEEKLEGHDEEDYVFGQWLRAAELGDLGEFIC